MPDTNLQIKKELKMRANLEAYYGDKLIINEIHALEKKGNSLYFDLDKYDNDGIRDIVRKYGFVGLDNIINTLFFEENKDSSLRSYSKKE
jgi:hypothetical protein